MRSYPMGGGAIGDAGIMMLSSFLLNQKTTGSDICAYCRGRISFVTAFYQSAYASLVIPKVGAGWKILDGSAHAKCPILESSASATADTNKIGLFSPVAN